MESRRRRFRLCDISHLACPFCYLSEYVCFIAPRKWLEMAYKNHIIIYIWTSKLNHITPNARIHIQTFTDICDYYTLCIHTYFFHRAYTLILTSVSEKNDRNDRNTYGKCMATSSENCVRASSNTQRQSEKLLKCRFVWERECEEWKGHTHRTRKKNVYYVRQREPSRPK